MPRKHAANWRPGTADGRTQDPCYTDPVKRNLTLTLDEDLLKAARKAALDRNTSVNQLVREYLEGLVQQSDRRKAALADIQEMFRTTKIQIGKRNWTRDDLYER